MKTKIKILLICLLGSVRSNVSAQSAAQDAEPRYLLFWASPERVFQANK